jgi:hypothetical protein
MQFLISFTVAASVSISDRHGHAVGQVAKRLNSTGAGGLAEDLNWEARTICFALRVKN